MKIETTYVLKDLHGKPLKFGDKDLTVGMALANILLTVRTDGYHFDKDKLYVLSTDLHNKKSVDIDASDAPKLIKTINTDISHAPIVTGQLLQILNKVQ